MDVYGPRKTLYNWFVHCSERGQSITALFAVRIGLMKQIKEMYLVLREFAHRSQSCRQLKSIPDVGVQTSAAFAAAIDEVGRF